VPPETIWKNLCSQTVELVLTAHPTEVNRRTIIDKHKRVQKVWLMSFKPMGLSCFLFV
jgi:phosphoenolpyruvate carboxylase